MHIILINAPKRILLIGFAKFHSRLEALEARDVLTGRKVDVEKNCSLKAEMAKKNLHTKRGLSSLGLSTAVAATFGLDTPSTALSFQQQAVQQSQQPPPPQSQQQSALPRTAGLTNNMLASANRPEHLRISSSRTFNPFNDAPLASAPILGANAHRSFSSNQFSSAFSSSGDQPASSGAGSSSIPPMPGTAGTVGGFMYSDHQLTSNLASSGSHSNMLLGRRGSVHSSTPVSSSLGLSASSLSNSVSVAAHQQQQSQQQALSESNSCDGDALHMNIQPPQPAQQQQQQQQQASTQPQTPSQSQQQQEQQLSQSQQQQSSTHKGLANHRPAVLDLAALQPRINQMNLGHLSAASLISPMGVPYSATIATTPVGMVLPMATTRSVNSNDQNPPCNTLYVGNLPPSAKEDELRALFRNILGYKRMSFRTKPNSGPMCFVEFESIDFATLAMNDMDGRMLSSSVGSGIRLSYSKNPLGIRSQNNPNGSASAGIVSSATLNSAAMAAAAAAMASGYSTINGSPYGYPLSALHTPLSQPQQQPPQQLRDVSPIHQGVAATLRQAATPSPPISAPTMSRTATMSNTLHSNNSNQHKHHLSMSSSSQASPIPSPTTAQDPIEQQQQQQKQQRSGSTDSVPKDALSFLHQPIHQLEQ
ncbi:cell cycle RNA binding protein whi3 [Coemansia sp. RSA 1933]|nr:cell cycle RNA binding protein whi3 [Coemansia sp. RSA 1933]